MKTIRRDIDEEGVDEPLVLRCQSQPNSRTMSPKSEPAPEPLPDVPSPRLLQGMEPSCLLKVDELLQVTISANGSDVADVGVVALTGGRLVPGVVRAKRSDRFV